MLKWRVTHFSDFSGSLLPPVDHLPHTWITGNVLAKQLGRFTNTVNKPMTKTYMYIYALIFLALKKRKTSLLGGIRNYLNIALLWFSCISRPYFTLLKKCLAFAWKVKNKEFHITECERERERAEKIHIPEMDLQSSPFKLLTHPEAVASNPPALYI